jgi:hypothetical protein
MEVMQTALQRWDPLERVRRRCLAPTAIFCSIKDVAQGVLALGGEAVGPLVEGGWLELIVSALNAYQLLARPEESSVALLQWGVLSCLEVMLGASADQVRKKGPLFSRFDVERVILPRHRLGTNMGKELRGEMAFNFSQAAPVIARLRSIGPDAFRYLLNEPLTNFADMGWVSEAAEKTPSCFFVLHFRNTELCPEPVLANPPSQL